MRIRRSTLAVAAVLLLISGCATPKARAAAATTAARTLDFTGTTLDGAAFDARVLAGRPAILWFWAPWCATCASEAQTVASMNEEYGARLGILGIAGMGDNKAMHEFVTDLEVGAVPHLDDQAGVVWKRFGITEQSTYVLVDRAGTVVRTGYLDSLQLAGEVRTLVT